MTGATRRSPRARRAALAAVTAFVALGLAACGPRRPAARTQPPRDNDQQSTRPRQLLSQGVTVRWHEKGPAGKLRRVLEVVAASGQLQADTESGVLNDARGSFYRNDEPRARFTAPRVEAWRARRLVIAEGGVRLESVDPPGLTVTADRVVWHTDTDRIVGRGNVRFQHQPPGSASVAAEGGPFDQVTIDTGMRRITIP